MNHFIFYSRTMLTNTVKIKAFIMAMKTTDKASISITRVKSMNKGLKETERNRACTRMIRKKLYEMV